MSPHPHSRRPIMLNALRGTYGGHWTCRIVSIDSIATQLREIISSPLHQHQIHPRKLVSAYHMITILFTRLQLRTAIHNSLRSFILAYSKGVLQPAPPSPCDSPYCLLTHTLHALHCLSKINCYAMSLFFN